MPQFTALIRAESTLGLAETLRSARVASETLVIHPSDATIERVCFRYGARDKFDVPGVTLGAYAMDAFYDWLLILRPGEELSGDLLDELGRWRPKRDSNAGYLLRIGDGSPQFRLINRDEMHWVGELPPAPSDAALFPGAITMAAPRRAA
jgi:hypothetical protein